MRKLGGIKFDFYKQYQDTWLVLDTLNKKKVSLENKCFHCGQGKPCHLFLHLEIDTVLNFAWTPKIVNLKLMKTIL